MTTSAPPELALTGGSNNTWGRPSPWSSAPRRRWRSPAEADARLFHRGGHGQPLLNLCRQRLSAQRLGMGLRRHDPHAVG
jgi:hypothetical protein